MPQTTADSRTIFVILGLLLMALASAMLPSALVDAAADNPDWRVFLIAASFTFFTGTTLYLTNRNRFAKLSIRGSFILTNLAWIVLSAFSALPFLFSSTKLDYADAFFEAISGLTTTGSTILSHIESLPPGILLWRALLQWIGGVGIIAMAIVILPILQVGGMQLFRMESSDRSEKVLPRPAQLSRAIFVVYLLLTIGCASAYWLAGMTPFQAALHAMTTVSTGGFSSFDTSLGHFSQAGIHWTAIAFMILGSLPFVLYIRTLRGDRRAFLRDSQVRTFLLMLLAATVFSAFWLHFRESILYLDALRYAAFTVVSIVTTTGFTTIDYSPWQGIAILIFVLTMIGGCTGSTAGGIKVFRFELITLIYRRQVRQLIRPHDVVVLSYNGRVVHGPIRSAVMGFVAFFLLSVAATTVGLTIIGLDFVTSISSAVTALCNVGPGLGPVVGPSGSFAPLPDNAKWILSAAMLLGRLELQTVLVLLLPAFWQGWTSA